MSNVQTTQPPLHLRLYVVGGARNSIAAIRNLNAILARRGADSFTLDVVDCVAEPRRALAEGILVTPTLVRVSPPPSRTIVGSLSELEHVAAALGLEDPSSTSTDDE